MHGRSRVRHDARGPRPVVEKALFADDGDRLDGCDGLFGAVGRGGDPHLEFAAGQHVDVRVGVELSDQVLAGCDFSLFSEEQESTPVDAAAVLELTAELHQVRLGEVVREFGVEREVHDHASLLDPMGRVIRSAGIPAAFSGLAGLRARYVRIGETTLPATSVSRKSRPL